MFANLVLVLINLINLAVALLLGEYEVAKLRQPDVSWIPTNARLDLSLVSVIGLLGLINLATLVFVIQRRLDRQRRWLWWTTALAVVCLIVLIGILGKSFLPILWPTL